MGVSVRAGAVVFLAVLAGPILAPGPAVAAAGCGGGAGSESSSADGGVDAAVEAFSSGAVVYTDRTDGSDGSDGTEGTDHTDRSDRTGAESGGPGETGGDADGDTPQGGWKSGGRQDGGRQGDGARGERVEAYARARLRAADVPVRAEVLEEGDPAAAAQETAARVGRPGLYVAAVERRGSTGGEDAEFGWSWVGTAEVADEELDGHFAYYPGAPLERIAGVVDLIDDDLRPAVEKAAASERRVYVAPSIAEGFPEADAGTLADRIGDLRDVRVAVIPALAGSAAGEGREESAEALLAAFDGKGSALLAEWSDGAFELTPASGAEGPAPSEIASVLPDGAPGGLGAAVGAFAGAVHGGVVDDAREGLADGNLYVHPLAATDLEEGDAEKVGAALAGREVPVRVAVVPQGAYLETGAATANDEALAASVAQGADGPVAVYAVDGGGLVTGYPVSGGDGVGGNWDELDSAVFFGKDDDSVRESLDGLLEELGGDRVLGGGGVGAAGGGPAGTGAVGDALDALESASGRALPWIGGGAGLLLLGLLLRGPFGAGKERRRASAAGLRARSEGTREEGLEEARTEEAHEEWPAMDELRAEEAERVEEIRARNAEGITRLGEELATARPHDEGERGEAFESWLREYESLKTDNPEAEDMDRIVAVRKRVEAALAEVERWDRR